MKKRKKMNYLYEGKLDLMLIYYLYCCVTQK